MFAYCGNNPVNRVDSTGYCYYTAGGVWTHDAWEYIGGYTRLPDPGYYAGTTGNGTSVYVATNTNYSTPPKSVKVVDQRDTNINPETGEHNPNFKIINSHLITNKSIQKEILNMLSQYSSNHPSTYIWNRSTNSLLIEWDAHNLFAPFDQSASEVDFDNDEEGMGLEYFIAKAIVRGIDKYIKPYFSFLP